MSKAEFQTDALSVSPCSFLDYKDYLRAVYKAIKHNRKRYSYIQFSEELGLGRCNASYLILHGQRPLTVKAAKKIIAAIGLRGVDRQFFIKLVEMEALSSKEDRDRAIQGLIELKTRVLPSELDRHQLEFHSEWHHAAVLEVLSQPHAKDDPDWLAQALLPRITPTKAAKSLQLLKDIGYISFDQEAGRLVPAANLVSTGPEVVGMAVMSFHQQMIDLAKESLIRISPYERNISGVTVSVSKKQREMIKGEIESLRRRIIEISKDVTDADEVVQVNFQLFPIAKIEGEN